ncbi:hypothetical protein XH88_35050 [Bradyrhizobium sp. CCBAU 51627]|nr:hypothetical protein [Bradyrhizobium sp. CCBAU 51627]
MLEPYMTPIASAELERLLYVPAPMAILMVDARASVQGMLFRQLPSDGFAHHLTMSILQRA